MTIQLANIQQQLCKSHNYKLQVSVGSIIFDL